MDCIQGQGSISDSFQEFKKYLGDCVAQHLFKFFEYGSDRLKCQFLICHVSLGIYLMVLRIIQRTGML